MQRAKHYQRTVLLAAMCCLALCSCRLTRPVSQKSRTPIMLTADRDSYSIRFAGDTRYAPPELSSAALERQPLGIQAPAQPANIRAAANTNTSPTAATNWAKVDPAARPTGVIVSDDGGVTPASLNDSVTYSPDQSQAGPARQWAIYGVDPRNGAAPPMTLPLEGYTGYPGDHYTVPGYVPRYMQGLPQEVTVSDGDGGQTDPSVHESTRRVDDGIPCGPGPLSNHACGPWKPPGIFGPWPEDEYLFDGGDSDGQVRVLNDSSLRGLDSEDTIVHYDTLDGRTIVKPSCRVCIYSPRFAAVRQVTQPYGDNQLVKAGGVDMPIGPVPQLDITPVASAVQPIQAVGETGARGPITFLENTPPIGLISQTVIRATLDRLKPYEDFEIIRTGEIIEAEMALVHRCTQAAIIWTEDIGVQVTIGGVKAVVLEGDKRAQATYAIEPGKPCLRICKVASTHSAKPGDIVEFTLRFDNVGEQPVGNVTIVDDLTTRLQLVEGSGQCSKDAKFMTEANKEGSLILRWEIDKPINPGDGGIARFKCVVR